MQLYKRVIILISQALITMLALSSCIGDNYDCDGIATPPETTLNPGKYRFDFIIDPVGSAYPGARSRAVGLNDGNFNDGDDFEYRIGRTGNLALFFDNNSNFLYTEPLELSDETMAGEENITVKYTAQLTYLNGEPVDEISRFPSSVLLVVNVNNDLYTKLTGITAGTSLDNIVNSLTDGSDDPFNIGRSESGLFTMTNSVYFGGGRTPSGITVPVSVDNIITDDDTDEKIESKIIHVQVERMVAKVTFKIDLEDGATTSTEGKFSIEEDGAMIFTPKENEIVYCDGIADDGTPIHIVKYWRAKLTGWATNALEQDNYIIKNIQSTTYFPDYNDQANYRTYWAEDLNYKSGNYPWQYRKAVDYILPTGNYESLAENNNNTLLNFSYEDIVFPNPGDMSLWNRVVYIPENTYDSGTYTNEDYDNRVNLLVGSHIIVTAEIQIADTKDGVYTTPENLYRDRTGIFYTNHVYLFWSLIRSFNLALASQFKMDYIYYDWGDEKTGEPFETYSARTDAPDDAKYCLYYGGKKLEYTNRNNLNLPGELLVKATVKDGDGRLIVYIPSLTIENGQGNGEDDRVGIYNYINETPTVVGGKDDDPRTEFRMGNNDRKSIFYEWTGAIDHFINGKMYYSAPVSLGAVKDSGNNPIYGTVRNAWYRFVLSDLKKIGTSIDVTSDPIVPNHVSSNDQINLTVDIINWHDFNIQGPTLDNITQN